MTIIYLSTYCPEHTATKLHLWHSKQIQCVHFLYIVYILPRILLSDRHTVLLKFMSHFWKLAKTVMFYGTYKKLEICFLCISTRLLILFFHVSVFYGRTLVLLIAPVSDYCLQIPLKHIKCSMSFTEHHIYICI